MIKRLFAYILFFAGLFTLIGLGAWQCQRLQWKEVIIADLDVQYERLPTKSALLSRARIDEVMASGDPVFVIDKVQGRFLNNKIVFVGPRSINGTMGYDVIAPMDTGEGTLLVHLGWLEDEKRDTVTLPGTRTILHGVARMPDYSRFASNNNPAQDIWLRIDIGQIAQARTLTNVWPVVFYVYESTEALQGIVMAQEKWYPRNKHFQYMLFWFGMAAAWIAVFILSARRKS